MKVSSRGRYGLKAMADLAMRFGPDYIPLKDIATRQNIPLKYLEQIFGALTKGGLLTSVKGAQGGYQLAKRPAEIKVLHILRLLEGRVTESKTINDVTDIEYSISQVVYKKADECLLSLLENISLEDIVIHYKKVNAQNISFSI
ncbi:MAG TPA: Rrf2 family transcriptional regulator [Clostridiales bacterium]|jgi:Rrf2 family protein|nr:Rrf2 family transcriptional regulator [Clostridiales bacterium]